jgi:iron complex outermembrane receptor protein
MIPESWVDAGIDGGILYASYSTGFKAGGFSSVGESFTPFDPETLSTFELGYKLDFWDSRVRLNGAFYYTEYDDIQIRVTRTIPRENLPPLTFSGVTNAGSATINGAEIEFTVLPTDFLTLGVNASYIDAKYDEFDDEDGSGETIDRSDEDFAFIPELTYAVFAQADWFLDVGEVTARVDGSYQDETFIGLDAVAAAEPKAYLDDYTTWNFRAAFRPEALEGLEIAGYVNNFTDEEYFGSGFVSIDGVGAASVIPGKQRTYGVEVGYRW